MIIPGQMAKLEMELNAVLLEFTPQFEDDTSQGDNDFPASGRAVHFEPGRKFLDPISMQELIDKLDPLLEMGSPDCRELIDSICLIPEPASDELKMRKLKKLLIQQIEELDFVPAVNTFTEIKKRMVVR